MPAIFHPIPAPPRQQVGNVCPAVADDGLLLNDDGILLPRPVAGAILHLEVVVETAPALLSGAPGEGSGDERPVLLLAASALQGLQQDLIFRRRPRNDPLLRHDSASCIHLPRSFALRA